MIRFVVPTWPLIEEATLVKLLVCKEDRVCVLLRHLRSNAASSGGVEMSRASTFPGGRAGMVQNKVGARPSAALWAVGAYKWNHQLLSGFIHPHPVSFSQGKGHC